MIIFNRFTKKSINAEVSDADLQYFDKIHFDKCLYQNINHQGESDKRLDSNLNFRH